MINGGDAAQGHAHPSREELEAEIARLRAALARRGAGPASAENDDRYRTLLESATDYAIIAMDRDGRITEWNRGAENVLGWTQSEVLGRDSALIWTPEDRRAGLPEAEMRKALDQGSVVDERWHLRRGGARVWVQGRLMSLRGGQPGFLKILRDHTAAHQADRDRDRLLAMLGQSQTMVCDWESRIEVWSEGMERMFGFTAAEAVGVNSAALLRSEFPEPWSAVQATLRREGRWQGEARHHHKDGSLRIAQATWLVQPGLDGEQSSLVVAKEDQTIVKRAEAALRRANETLEAQVEARTAELRRAVQALHDEAVERGQAEEALRQSHKMEAVGQLTGGIAHDFNNMLQGIASGLELVRRRLEQGRPEDAKHFIDAAQKMVDRAGALTHRLLAFARRQALQPKPVEPDELIAGIAELIQRTVGPGVTVELRPGDGVWAVLCDPNQLENTLLNLAINARDAMPRGGRLTIGTTDARLSAADVADQDGTEPGEYVEITVADTGTGMTPDVLERAFEPFFTTKPIGQGTGLGLSQLYGFARQSGGLVRLDSAPGRGTTVRLYLPRYANADEPAQADGGPVPADVARSGAGETVLLVEDEAQVRAMATEALRELGYRVLEAGDGSAALRVLLGSRGFQVDLLVTDVGLPNGLNGRQVAEIARGAWPGLKVLFITGYAGNTLDEQLAPGMEVIGKPFSLDTMADKVRRMIEGEETVARATQAGMFD